MNIKILVCQIIGPASAGFVGYVPCVINTCLSKFAYQPKVRFFLRYLFRSYDTEVTKFTLPIIVTGTAVESDTWQYSVR